ncbi:Bug family tripartite tricarboxylate transporter substrate binding protein [Candidimonas nitroreducens]|uniref:LacI family transcriptional regulator n=1 Tax=Candidimonas nitroreducens TaxID=683354 RepID=A0A225MZJ9_9BURK|nr:tripartite tricarboxylate transporter substrate binding protein [Candidimonas nitroreducens]OWT64109.1 LacI family transcriptional regulator [Candidimonas nitroreducens]
MWRHVFAVFLVLYMPALSAHPWPDHPIKYVVPFPPGGATDIISRQVAAQLQEKLHESVVVENVGGAGGAIGVGRLARSSNDGYTIGLGNSGTLTMAPYLQKVAYDPAKDFTPISMLTEYSNVLVVGKALNVKSLDEFLALARSREKSLTYGSAGNGSSNHMTSLLFAKRAGVKFLHIPYKGNNPALMAVISGEIDWMFATISEIKPFLQSGQLIPLGVSSLKPDPLLPGVPPISKTLSGFDVVGFMGLFGPRNVPTQAADKLTKAVAEVLTDPKTIEKFASMGMTARPSSQAELAERVEKDGRLWKSVIDESQIKVN